MAARARSRPAYVPMTLGYARPPRTEIPLKCGVAAAVSLRRLLGHDRRSRDRGPDRRHELLAGGPLTIDELTEQRRSRCPGLTTTLNIVSH
jgi:hypothetical protein